MIKTTNPAIKNMEHYCSGEELVDEKKVATYKGVAYKSLYYVALTLIAAFGTAILLVRLPAFSVLIAACVIAPIGALVCSLIASFAPATVPVTGSLYAIFEGAFVGAYSKLIDLAYPGVAFAALVSTRHVRHNDGAVRDGRYPRGKQVPRVYVQRASLRTRVRTRNRNPCLLYTSDAADDQ